MAINSPKSYDTELGELLNKIDSGELQLPDFQRDWTWDVRRIANLIASVSKGFPMGAIMQLERGGNDGFKYRVFEGADATHREPTHLVLDGQQRLTSLYRALYSPDPVTTEGKGKAQYFYLDMRKCLDDFIDREEAVFTVDADKKLKTDFDRQVILDLSSTELEVEQLMFPANLVFDLRKQNAWFARLAMRYGFDSPELNEVWYPFSEQVLNTIADYKVPVITLPRESSAEAVCKVFEYVNTGGVSLTVFELVTAKFAASGDNLRDSWEYDAKPVIYEGKEGSIVTDLMEGVDKTMFLTAMTLYSSYKRKRRSGKGTTTCKKRDVLALPREDYKANLDELLDGFNMTRDFLVGEGVYRQIDLPYTSQIIPLAATLAIMGRKRFANPVVKKMLQQWYWCGVLGAMYGGSNETRYANDIDDLISVVEGTGDKVRTVDDAYFQTPRLLRLQTRTSAAYKGVMALVFKANAEDFIDGERMSIVKADITPPDIHHIFPKNYCLKMNYAKSKWNSVVNKTPLIKTTNIVLGGVAPSEYIRRIERKAQISEDELKPRIESHLIDFDLLKADDFDDFFVERARVLLDAIEDAMGKPIQDRASEEVVRTFGTTLESRRR